MTPGNGEAREQILQVKYDAFGNPEITDSLGNGDPEDIDSFARWTGRFFRGQEYHESLGLYHYGGKWYDQVSGRFISANRAAGDPFTSALTSDTNAYRFSGNNFNDGGSGFSALDGIHLALDGIGLIPGIGIFADGLNSGIYFAEGKYKLAALSGVAAIPIVGYGAAAVKGVRAAGNTLRFTRRLETATNFGLSAYGTYSGVQNGSVLQAGLGAIGLGASGRTVGRGINKVLTHGVSDFSTFSSKAGKVFSNIGQGVTGRRIACFVAGTPVLVPIVFDEQAMADIAVVHNEEQESSAVAFVAIGLGISGFAAAQLLRAKAKSAKEEQKNEKRETFFVPRSHRRIEFEF